MDWDGWLPLARPQLRPLGVPERLWPALHTKLVAQPIADAGDYVMVVKVELDGGAHRWAVQTVRHLAADDDNCIFPLDHVLTFGWRELRPMLSTGTAHGTLRTLAALLDIDESVAESDQLIDAIVHRLRTAAKCYTVLSVQGRTPSAESSEPIWYLPDIVGCRVGAAPLPADANCMLVPFVEPTTGLAYDLLFVTRHVEEGEFLLADYAPGYDSGAERDVHLLPWVHTDFSHESDTPSAKDEQYFLADRNRETPAECGEADSHRFGTKVERTVYQGGAGAQLLVHSDDDRLLRRMRSDSRFVPVESADQAHILWYTRHFYDYRWLRSTHPTVLINQYSGESALTVKDLLCALVQHRAASDEGRWPHWFPRTYNLHTDLRQFAAHFQKRGAPSAWVVKPWNMARGLQVAATDSLQHIVKLATAGAPKVASEYVHPPLLFHRSDVAGGPVKFDLRYIVLLLCARPVRALAFNKFWIRFANRPYDYSRLDDHGAHFTVHNYDEPDSVLQMRSDDFIAELERQQAKRGRELAWFRDVQRPIDDAIWRCLHMACTDSSWPCGLSANAQCRACYGVDVMLADGENGGRPVPKIVEFNYMPDCERACDYDPHFADALFEAMFVPGDYWTVANGCFRELR